MISNSWKSWTIWLNSGSKMLFNSPGVPCTFQGAGKKRKNHPCTFGEQTIAGEDVSPVIAVVGRLILWFNLGRFFARWLLAKNHGWLLPQKHGQNLWLSEATATKAEALLEQGPQGRPHTTSCLILYVAGPGPLLHGWCLQFCFGEHSRNPRFWRNANFVSEPLAARMDGRCLYHMCVLDTVCECTWHVIIIYLCMWSTITKRR